MKIGLYVGSFSPWHKGHQDVLDKALKVFDEVYVVTMLNPEKHGSQLPGKLGRAVHPRVRGQAFKGTLKGLVKEHPEVTGIIRGLRDGKDLDYERNQQYWNEDVGIEVPFVYFIADRTLTHVSSSAIRMVNKLGLEHKY